MKLLCTSYFFPNKQYQVLRNVRFHISLSTVCLESISRGAISWEKNLETLIPRRFMCKPVISSFLRLD